MTEAILHEVSGFRTLDEALRWALARAVPGQVVAVVAQDEYTHDVVFRIEEEIFLAFDTT
jgi:hypothetical protein